LAVLVAALPFLHACTGSTEPAVRSEPGVPDTQLGGGPAEEVAEPATETRSTCQTDFAGDDLAGFVHEWFAVVAGLQLSIDVNPVRQILGHPDGSAIEKARSIQECSARMLAPFRESSDARTSDLARATSALLAEVASVEARNAGLFRSTDWSAYPSSESKARRWSEIRPSTRELSERGAKLTERLVPLLREDDRMTFGPGRLRITRAGREVALRNRGRLTDLSGMIERGIDPGGPLSETSRKILKWLHHAHGLVFREPG
jgi:hypothetical protein